MTVLGSRRALGRRATRGGVDGGCLPVSVTRRRDGTSGRCGRGLVVRGLLGTLTIRDLGPPRREGVVGFVGWK